MFLSDASNSIDNAEIKFQRSGYASAVTHRDVLDAISKGDLGRIAVTFIEWGDDYQSGRGRALDHHQGSRERQEIRDGPARRPAQGLRLQRYRPGDRHRTQVEIEKNDINGHRKVIDLSGDSANNWNGIPIEDARKRAVAAGIIINGLAILCRADELQRPAGQLRSREGFRDAHHRRARQFRRHRRQPVEFRHGRAPQTHPRTRRRPTAAAHYAVRGGRFNSEQSLGL